MAREAARLPPTDPSAVEVPAEGREKAEEEEEELVVEEEEEEEEAELGEAVEAAKGGRAADMEEIRVQHAE